MRALLPVLALFVACQGGKDDSDPVEGALSGCDPLVPELCSLPWPSSYFQVPAETPSGVQNRFFPDSLPINVDLVRVSGAMLDQFDGFSTGTGLAAYFPGASVDNLISHVDLDGYLAADVTTVLINTRTGERVPHFAEIDQTTSKVDEQLFLIRPVVPLDNSTRYVVGIRGVVDGAGALMAASSGFTALRDAAETDDYDLEHRRARFDSEVFPALEAQGFARAELQLAWDFTTVSQDSTLRRVLHMRDDMLSDMPAGGPAFTIDLRTDFDCEAEGTQIGRELRGKLIVPLYTTADTANVFLTVGEDGLPFRNGDATSEFLVRIPCSVLDNPREARVMQYGHGLLGDRLEARTGHLSRFANERGFIVFAQDWKGMSARDYASIALMIAQDPGRFGILPERSQQGLIEKVAGARLVKGALGDHPDLMVGEQRLIDADDVVYYGISQGGIMGSAYMGLTPEITRGVFSVNGGPYSLLLPRSVDFNDFFRIFDVMFDDHRDIALLILALQTPWDVAEPQGWLKVTTENTVPNTPAKQILMQVGIGDAQVTTLGAHIQARAYGAKLLGPATRPVWGVDEVASPYTGSALVEWEYVDGSTEPVVNLPPLKEGDTHECPRREPEAQEQIWHFYETGELVNTCEGPCVSARAGLCD